MKKMYTKVQYLCNTMLIVLALTLGGIGCGGVDDPVPPIPANTEASFFCNRIYNAQANYLTKLEFCTDSLDADEKFYGYDIPGFYPNTGFCSETFGATCYTEAEALRGLEGCLATMPVCHPEVQDWWLEAWGDNCAGVFNALVKDKSCQLVERKP